MNVTFILGTCTVGLYPFLAITYNLTSLYFIRFISSNLLYRTLKLVLCDKLRYLGIVQIFDNLEIKDKSQVFQMKPGQNDVDCVILVLKYDTELGDELRRQLDVIIQLGGMGGK